MPLTPFHVGPGILFKSVLRRYFSLFVFIWSQILIDSETAWNIIAGHERLHTFFHTFIGSLVIVVILAFITKPLFKITMWFWSPSYFAKNLVDQFPLLITIASALIGVWSHVFLDSIMHQDITPFSPFSNANPFLGMLSLDQLHLGCIYSGLLGIIFWVIRLWFKSSWYGRSKVKNQPS